MCMYMKIQHSACNCKKELRACSNIQSVKMDAYIQNGGSRNSDGNVPYVNLNRDGKVNVNWNNLSNSNPNYGTRREVLA